MKHKAKHIHFVGTGAEPCSHTAFHNVGVSRAASEQRT